MNTSKKIVLTPEGLAQIQEELRSLKEEKRVEVAERLKEAISYGDLSENSEYEDARNEQSQMELRINELEDILKNYELVDTERREGGRKKRIMIGNKVTIAPIHAGKIAGEEETYEIVGSTESDIFKARISNESPLGNALIGHGAGEVISYRTPAGEYTCQIMTIE